MSFRVIRSRTVLSAVVLTIDACPRKRGAGRKRKMSVFCPSIYYGGLITGQHGFFSNSLFYYQLGTDRSARLR